MKDSASTFSEGAVSCVYMRKEKSFSETEQSAVVKEGFC